MAGDALPVVERTERSGVPVFWSEAPAPTRGALAFRVGRADEWLARLGITHLVEHLAMFAIGRPQFASNAVVTDNQTLFFAEGSTDEVCGFFESITRSLAKLPLERLETERRVLQTEAANAPPNFVGRLMAMRYGPAGYGLGSYDELGLRHVGEDEVAAWCARHFTGGNAAAWLSAEPPEGLSLELPSGEALAPPEPEPIAQLTYPAYLAEGTGGVAVTFVGRRTPAMVAAGAIASERIHDRLRLEEGVTYGVDGSYIPLTAEWAHCHIGADCIDENAASVRDGLRDALTSLAEEGASEAELVRYVDGVRRSMVDPAYTFTALDGRMSDHQFGKPAVTAEQLMREAEELRPAEISRALAEALAGEILLAPETLDAVPEGFVAYRSWEHRPVEGRAFKPKRSGLRRPSHRYVAGDDGISLLQDGEVITIRFADCVTVIEETPGELAMLGADESFIRFEVRGVEGGEELELLVRERVPAELFVPPEPRSAAVEAAAEQKLKRRWVVGDELRELPEMLEPGEEPVSMAEAARGLKAGLIVATDRRVLWVFKGVRKEDRIEYAYDSLRGARTGLQRDTLILDTTDGKVRFTDVAPRARAAELAAEISARAAAR